MHPFFARFRSPFVWVPLLCGVVYGIFIRPGQLNYFRELAGAFLEGKLYLANPSNTHDLVFFGGKYFLYWPPVPALVWLPLVALFGNGFPDGIPGMLAGLLNVWFVMRLLREFAQRAGHPLPDKTLAWAGAFWGLGTTQFHLAPPGNTWFFAQTVAQTFLLPAMLLFVRNKSWFWSGLLFALAVYCRNTLVFAGLFFWLIYVAQNAGLPWKVHLRRAFLFLLPFVAFSVVNAAYNYARFSDVWENGLRFHLMDEHFVKSFQQHGYFSLHYLPYNFYVEVLHAPTFIPRVPFVMDEPEGFGFLWASPFFFLIFPALLLWIKNRFSGGDNNRFFRWTTSACWIAAVPIAITIFLIMGTGWRQYGARYTFDFQVFLLLFLALLWPQLARFRWMPKLGVALVVFSVAMQAAGIP